MDDGARLPSPEPSHDIVGPDLRALIVAINPSPRSAAIGHAFASPTNPFWRLLHASGLTTELLAPSEEARLLEFGLGLTSLVARPTSAASEVTAFERRAGASRVRALVALHRPRHVALLGLTLTPAFFPVDPPRGPGLHDEFIEGARLYVLPNPSGRNRAYPGFERKLVWYEGLARRLGSG